MTMLLEFISSLTNYKNFLIINIQLIILNINILKSKYMDIALIMNKFKTDLI